MNLLKRQRDAIGLSTFTHKLDFHSPNRTTLRHYRLLYNELDKLLKVNAIDQKRETASSEVLHQISEMLYKRSMVMVFTDMIADDKDLEQQFEAFKHLKYNKHEVVLFYLTEPKTEIDLEFEKFTNNPEKESKNLIPSRYHHKTEVMLAIGMSDMPNINSNFNRDKKSFNICYVGKLVYWKGVLIVLKTYM